MLASEIGAIERKGIQLAGDLKTREQSNLQAEKSWSRYLRETVQAYRSAPQHLQNHLFAQGLKTLADSRKLLEQRKLQEKVLREKLGEVVAAGKKKGAQFEQCNEKKNLSQAKRSNLREQQHVDGIVSLVRAKKDFENSEIDKLASKKDTDDDSFATAICSEPAKISIVEPSTSGQGFVDNSSFPTLLPQPETITPTQSNNGDCADAIAVDYGAEQQAHSQQKWQQAEETEEGIRSANESVKVSVVQHEDGSSVHIDYLAGPGRLVSVAGISNKRSTEIDLAIATSSKFDFLSLSSERLGLLQNLRSQGLQISSFNLAQK